MRISDLNQRVMTYDGTTWKDLTIEINDYNFRPQAIELSTTKFLYIATPLPFNHKFFKIGPGNSLPADLKIEIYDGNEWEEVVNILDYTQTLKLSGNLTFTTDPDEGWGSVDDSNEDVEALDGSPRIYDMYWMRLSSSVEISFSCKFLGHLFCTENEFLAKYPLLNQPTLLNQWGGENKSNWEQQRLQAAMDITIYLQNKGITLTDDQILDPSRFTEANIHRTAYIIFSGLGINRFEKEIEASLKRYYSALNMKSFNVDQNADGKLSRTDRKTSVRYLSR